MAGGETPNSRDVAVALVRKLDLSNLAGWVTESCPRGGGRAQSASERGTSQAHRWFGRPYQTRKRRRAEKKLSSRLLQSCRCTLCQL